MGNIFALLENVPRNQLVFQTSQDWTNIKPATPVKRVLNVKKKQFGAKRNLKRREKKKHNLDQKDKSVNSNHSDGDKNGNATAENQDPLGDALNVGMIVMMT